MNRICIAAIITITLSLCACSNEALFSISTGLNEDVNVIYTRPAGGSFSYMSTDTLRVFAGGGKTVFREEFTSPTPMYIRTEDGREIYLIAEKHGRYELQLNQGRINISGHSAQKLYNELPDPSSISEEAKKLVSYSSSKSLIELTDGRFASELQEFLKLRQKAEVSKAVYEHIKLERDLYWRAVRANVAYLHFIEKGILDPEDKKIWQSAFNGLNLNDKTLCRTRWYIDLAKSYVEYCLFSDPELDMDKLLKKASEGRLNSIYYEVYTHKFKGRCLEYLSSRMLYSAALQENYEKELIEIYDDFCSRFPESAYRETLDPMIEKIKDYHKATRSNEKIVILDNYLNINSFEEVLKRFRGKKLYIDVWASWCGPCKDEFKHKEKLQKLLEENGYELLYISIDDDKRARNWEEMIYSFDLEGYHIRAGEELNRQLFEVYGSQRLSIPWYMIVNEKGEITDRQAPRPGRLKSENLK